VDFLTKKAAALLLSSLLILNISACGLKKASRYEAQFLMLFDTLTTIVGYSNSEAEFTEHSQLIYDSLKEYHQLYDIYNEYEGINNLKTINDNAGLAPVRVDRRIIDLIRFSLDWYEKTDGRVNIAFGAVLEIWHDYRTEGTENPDEARLPPLEQLREAAEHTDISKIIINDEESTVFLEDPDMSLDVGAVAKGYAVEQVSRIAMENGFTSGLISVGGNVRAISGKDEIGNKNSSDIVEPWNVAVQNPDLASEQAQLHVMNLVDASLVTSGVYERFYIVDNKRYHHIIDTRTLYPSEYYSSVTIICRDSGMADALSTAVFNMPFEQGIEFVNGLDGVEALWVQNDGDVKYSDGFRALIME
jgi:thiamine biosynthesis lipoprotein